MTRSISIGYRRESGTPITQIEVTLPYDLFGCQRSSVEFWGLLRLREIGIVRLAELGVTDPVFFCGWDELGDLGREIALLQHHLRSIDF